MKPGAPLFLGRSMMQRQVHMSNDTQKIVDDLQSAQKKDKEQKATPPAKDGTLPAKDGAK